MNLILEDFFKVPHLPSFLKRPFSSLKFHFSSVLRNLGNRFLLPFRFLLLSSCTKEKRKRDPSAIFFLVVLSHPHCVYRSI